MKRLLACFILYFLSFGHIQKTFSWDDGITHKDLSGFAAETSVLRNCLNESDMNCAYLKKLGIDNGLEGSLQWGSARKIVKEWLQEGAELEDASNLGFPFLSGSTTRSYNHFHNPLKDWGQAGLNDLGTGESSLLWAQESSYQTIFPEGNWSWQKTRDYYYLALTSTSDANRQASFSKTFRGLGHQMHLLQDTSVPDHVRNDAHPEDAIFGRDFRFGSYYFETWAKENCSYQSMEA